MPTIICLYSAVFSFGRLCDCMQSRNAITWHSCSPYCESHVSLHTMSHMSPYCESHVSVLRVTCFRTASHMLPYCESHASVLWVTCFRTVSYMSPSVLWVTCLYTVSHMSPKCDTCLHTDLILRPVVRFLLKAWEPKICQLHWQNNWFVKA